jgi:hypothetical protein
MDARTKQIWKGLVSFANAGTIESAAKNLQRTVTAYMPWFSQHDPFNLLGEFTAVDWDAAAAEYQSPVRTVLHWACSPKSEVDAETETVAHPRESLEPQAFPFLREHAAHIGGLDFGEVPYVKEPPEPKPDASAEEVKSYENSMEQHRESMKYWRRDGKLRDDSLLRYRSITRSYKDVADPICEFICIEIQKFTDGEYDRPTPIFACPRCGKLVMPERVGRKKFCSECTDKARAEQHRKKQSPNEATDYHWLNALVKDLEHEPPNRIKMRLQNAKIRKRIEEISKRQRTSAKCKNLLGRLKQWRAIRVPGGFR